MNQINVEQLQYIAGGGAYDAMGNLTGGADDDGGTNCASGGWANGNTNAALGAAFGLSALGVAVATATGPIGAIVGSLAAFGIALNNMNPCEDDSDDDDGDCGDDGSDGDCGG